MKNYDIKNIYVLQALIILSAIQNVSIEKSISINTNRLSSFKNLVKDVTDSISKGTTTKIQNIKTSSIYNKAQIKIEQFYKKNKGNIK